jgi:flagellar biosynthesis protein FlhG
MTLDQATTLRMMTIAPSLGLESRQQQADAASPDAVADSSLPNRAAQPPARTIAVTGGKGGVGKSNIATNLALALAALNRRVALLDADLALANADVLLGLNPQYHLGHVLSGERTLAEVVIEVARNMRLIPGGSGVEELANLSRASHTRLVSELRAMEEQSDFMIVDTAAGIGANVMGVLCAATEVIIVTTPDPTAVVDAYATIKVLHNYAPQKPISLIVNNTVGIADAEQVYRQLRQAAARFLDHPIKHLGSIPHDAELVEAVREQTPVIEYAPGAPSSRAFKLIAKQLNDAHQDPDTSPTATPDSFWHSLHNATK